MSARHPAPWRAEGRDNGKRGRQRREFWAVLDRNGFFVAEGLDETTAREVVEAVNERDRLRDALNEVCRRASVALNCPRKDEEAIELLVHDLLGIKECARAAVNERAGRARAVAEAQREYVKETRVTFTFRDDGTWSTYCSANAESENMADVIACNVALYVGVAMNCMSEKELGKLVNKLQKVMVRDLKKRRAAK